MQINDLLALSFWLFNNVAREMKQKHYCLMHILIQLLEMEWAWIILVLIQIHVYVCL